MPGNFFIKKRGNVAGEAKPFHVSVDGSDVDDTVKSFEYKSENEVIQKRIDIFFSPAIHVEDLPLVFLSSLKINGKDFHATGIPFKAGKKKFYSAFVSPE